MTRYLEAHLPGCPHLDAPGVHELPPDDDLGEAITNLQAAGFVIVEAYGGHVDIMAALVEVQVVRMPGGDPPWQLR